MYYNNQWQSGIVEEVSRDRMSMEVQLFTESAKQWFDVQAGLVVPFGTRTGVDGSSNDMMGVPPLIALDSQGNNQTVVVSHCDREVDILYKNHIQVGSLVDVLSFGNHWVEVIRGG